MCLRYQRHNLESCSQVLLMRYEDLVTDPERAKRRILKFLPALGELRVDRTFNANNYTKKALAITDLNVGKIERIPMDQLSKIEEKLALQEELLQYFDYSPYATG